MRAERRRDGARGFTLLEVLVALAVFGFLMVGLTQGLRFGLQAWGVQARGTAQWSELDATDRALRRLIEQMDPGVPGTPPLLTAGPAALAFRSELPAAAAALATPRVSALLRVEPGGRLVLRWTPLLPPRPGVPPPPVQDTTLLTGVDHVAFSYLQPAAAGGGWVSAWHLPSLPVLVRIHIAFAAGDPRTWPDIVAAPVLDPAR